MKYPFSRITSLLMRIYNWFNTLNPTHRFLILLLLIALIYQYPTILFKRPQSVHHWRQSDCASVALNYYQTGMRFFQPQTHNLTSDDRTTGYVATSEIPIGYYFIAILYKIFGYHDFIYRLINTLIFLAGLFCLYKTLSLLIKDFFWPALLSLFFFTSPVLVYYGNNFLTDSSALSFALIAWYFFIKYYTTGIQKTYYISMIFFLLAGAYKVTSLISLMAIFGVFIFEILGIAKFRNGERLFPKPWLQIIPFIIIFVVTGAWVSYAKHYNQLHVTGYFSTQTFPLWDVDKDGIRKVLYNVRNFWSYQYFHIASLYLIAITFLLNIFFIKKSNRLLISTTLLLLLGTIFYVILQFPNFKDHDYYTLNLYILLIINMVAFAWMMDKHFSYIMNSKYIKIAFLLFLVMNVAYANNKNRERYYGYWTEHPDYKNYDTITPYLRSIGIQPSDTVICLPDYSHFTLYLMNQVGWTECYGLNRDSTSIESSIKKGAKYLITNGNEILSRDYIQSFLHHPVGQYGNIRIFDLKKRAPAKHYLYQKIEKINCGAEKLSTDGKYFEADSSDVMFDAEQCQCAEKVYSGKYAACLTKDKAFAMIYKFKNVSSSEHYTITTFRWSAQHNGCLVASTNNRRELYLNIPNKVEELHDGWEKLTLDFYVNFKPSDGQLNVYLWNETKTPVYFDDLTIIRRYGEQQ